MQVKHGLKGRQSHSKHNGSGSKPRIARSMLASLWPDQSQSIKDHLVCRPKIHGLT